MGPDPHESRRTYPPPVPQQPEGLLSKFSKPDPTGVSMADRIYAIGSILKGDSAGGMKYLQGQQLAAQEGLQGHTAAAQALKDKGNQAFRAAYQNGKFDPSTYASVMGDDLDPEAFAKLATAAGPKTSMSGSYAINTNPLGGGGIDMSSGASGSPDYAENTAAGNSAEQQRHNAVTEAQGAIHAAVAQGNAALAKQREGRVAAKAAGGGADWTHRVIGVGKVQ